MGVLRLGKMGHRLQVPQGHMILHPGWRLCYLPSACYPHPSPTQCPQLTVCQDV